MAPGFAKAYFFVKAAQHKSTRQAPFTEFSIYNHGDTEFTELALLFLWWETAPKEKRLPLRGRCFILGVVSPAERDYLSDNIVHR